MRKSTQIWGDKTNLSKKKVNLKANIVFIVQCKTVELGQSKTIQYSTVQYSTVQYSTVSTVHYSTVQYSTVQYSTVQHSTAQYLHVWDCENAQGTKY